MCCVTFRLTARCVRGLEWILAAEVAGVADGAAREITFGERQVSFETHEIDAGWLDLRTADDVLLDLGTLHGIDHTRAAVAELSRQLARVDFGAGLGLVQRARGDEGDDLGALPFDVVVSLLGRRNYNRFMVEDAAGEVVAKAVGARYASRNPSAGFGRAPEAAQAEFTVRLSLTGDTVDVALRLSRKPLHRRPWKLDTGPGTLHPPLAAALARIGGQGPLDTALDPFCGDGTVAIETAHAFPGARIVAADLDPERLANARSNTTRARVSSRTRFILADAGRPAWADGRFDLLVTNPPWNRAVGAAGTLADTLDPFWRAIPGALAAHGRICTVAEADLDVPARLDRSGYTVALAQTIRLAGRVSHVILAAPGYSAEVRLPTALDRWRERAIRAGIVSDGGF
jgi:tRNA (guanine6-N2)-methyltransferase